MAAQTHTRERGTKEEMARTKRRIKKSLRCVEHTAGAVGADREGEGDLPLARHQSLAAQSQQSRLQTILSFLHLSVLIVRWSLDLFNN